MELFSAFTIKTLRLGLTSEFSGSIPLSNPFKFDNLAIAFSVNSKGPPRPDDSDRVSFNQSIKCLISSSIKCSKKAVTSDFGYGFE